jgi:hypothetical protein
MVAVLVNGFLSYTLTRAHPFPSPIYSDGNHNSHQRLTNYLKRDRRC